MKRRNIIVGITVGIMGAGAVIFAFTGCGTNPLAAETVIAETEQNEETVEEISAENLAEDVVATAEAITEVVTDDISNLEIASETAEEYGSIDVDSKQDVTPKVTSDIESESSKDVGTESIRKETLTDSNVPKENTVKNNSETEMKTKSVETEPIDASANNSQPEPLNQAENIEVEKVIEEVSIPEAQAVITEETPVATQPAGHYEEIWIVDNPERVVEEPVTTQTSITICNGCGAEITYNLDTHLTEHFLREGSAPSYHDEIIYGTSTQTTVIPEQGHYEQVWVND